MASTIRVRATSSGDTTEVQALIQHPMDSGFVKDAQGQLIPPHFIQQVTFEHNGKTVFLADWGPEGYYGPVKSYEIMRATRMKSSNGIIVSVAVSPFSPMPGANDPVKNRRTKVIPLFVDVDSKAMSFSPTSPDEQ